MTTKRIPKYERDLRFDPVPGDATDDELEERAVELVDAVLSGAGRRQRPDGPRLKPGS